MSGNRTLNDNFRIYSNFGDLRSLEYILKHVVAEHKKNAYITAIIQNMRYNNNNDLFLDYFFGKKLVSIDEIVEVENSFLNVACKHGNLNYVKYLVDHGANVNKRNKKLKTPLHLAVSCGNIECARYLLRKGADIEAFDVKNKNALLKASTRGDIEMIKLLMEFGCSLDAKDKNHFGAVHYAAFKGQIETMKFLFSKGLNVLIKDKNGISLILQICGRKKAVNDNVEVVKLIVEKGGCIDDSSSSLQTPLLAAARAGNFKILKYLVESGCKIDDKNKQNKTAVHYAAQINHVEMMKYLVEKGLSLKEVDISLNTPLLTAAQNGSFDVVKYLLSQGCRLDETAAQKNTVFLKSIQSENLNLISFLLENGSSIDERDQYLNNALFSAAAKGNIEIANYLIYKGISVDDKNIFEENCLFYASTVEMLKFLISKGGKIEKNKMNFGPLLKASSGDNLELIKYLVEHSKESIKDVDEMRRGPLFKAIAKGNLNIIQYLIDVGCSISDLDSNFNTPVLYACGHGNLETIKYLMEKRNGFRDMDILGFTPLLKSVQNHNSIAVIEYLIQNGSCFKEKTAKGSNVLVLATMKKSKELVHYLLNSGVSMLEKNSKKCDSLSYAKTDLVPIFQNFQKSDEFKIQTSKYKLVPNAKNIERILMNCVIHGNLLVLDEGISRVDNINFTDHNGNGLLNLSIIYDKLDIFDYLIDHYKFDLNMKNSQNLTPIYVSMKKGNIHMLSRLLKAEGNVFNMDNKKFFENSRVHKDTFDFVFKWKIYSSSNVNLNFKFK